MIRLISIAEAKNIWPSILGSENRLPIQSWEWYEAWISVQTEYIPYILLINEQTIAPFIRKDNTVSFINLYTDYTDLIGENTPAIWNEILDYLKEVSIEKIDITNIPEGSHTVEFFITYKNEHEANIEIIENNTTPILDLPHNFDEYLQSLGRKRKRHRQFLRDHPQAKITIRQVNPEDIEMLIELMKLNPIKLASATLQKENFFRKIATFPKERVKLIEMRIDDTIVAARVAFFYKHEVLLYISGYLPEYNNSGIFLFIETIRYAISNGYTKFNFLRGNEPYKYELGAKDHAVYKIVATL